jgi:hypothetical protein
MGSTTAAGSAILMSVAAPATQDQQGFTALTFTEIGGVEKIGAIGASYAKTEFQPLKGAKQKYKGSADYGSLQPSIAIDEADAGQALLQTAADDETNKLFSFKVIKPDGAIRYFQGRVFGNPETIDGADALIMGNPNIEICTKVVKVPKPA